MDSWGQLDLTTAAIVRDDVGTSFRRTKKIVSTFIFVEVQTILVDVDCCLDLFGARA